METIVFTFEETGEDVEFAILSSLEYEEETYLLAVEKDELELDDMTAYVLKAISLDGEDVIYEIVDDDDELLPVSEKLMDLVEDIDIDM
ncbi:DUF1292 domain-containing protein [Vallitalea guaymasensis]|uniref:DUF1292 domain-containing protein n=1 Tax=Vallitalea guaymasensis TaxID=1185412 RepID=A0A8J8SDN7_9FIRM|nr:DUF1292 domain-containing protein [Vallitalea guaymasensis]QUH31012.1 DUF1292 domain-containing protein [Vallitalea guaymasensis]